MKTNEQQYYSYVTNRIQTLRMRLSKPNISALEKEFLESRINYLRNLIDLPALIAINNMTEDELQLVENKYGTRDRDFIVGLYGLEKIDAFVQKKKIIPLQYMKEAMVGDVDTMAQLIELHERNSALNMKKHELQGVGLTGDVTYQQIHQDTKNLVAYESNIERAYKNAMADYSVETLSELLEYKNDSSKPLSKSFILKHLNKVEKNPKLKKIAERLAGKGIAGKLDKFLPFRKKREQEFLTAVLDSYKTNKALPALNIKRIDIEDLDEKRMNKLVNVIEKQASKFRSEIAKRSAELQASRKDVSDEIKGIEKEQKQLKSKFMNLLATRTTFLPRIFQDQIWAEPNLKDTLKIAACFKDEKDIIEALNKMHEPPVVPISINSEKAEEPVVTKVGHKEYVKKAA